MKQRLLGRGRSRPGRPGQHTAPPASRADLPGHHEGIGQPTPARESLRGILHDLTTLGKATFVAAVISLALMGVGWHLYGKRGLAFGAGALFLTFALAASWQIARQLSRRSDELPSGVTAGPGARPPGSSDRRPIPPGRVGPSPPASNIRPTPHQRLQEEYPGSTPYHDIPAVHRTHPGALRAPPLTGEDTAVASPGLFPVVHQRSRMAAVPWRLPITSSPSGLAADQGRVGSLDVRAASLVGPAHRCRMPAQPRQDAYRLGQDARHDHLIVAVADGMSDSKHSDTGANVAASAVIGEIRARLDAGMSLDQLDADDIFAATAGQMIGAADQRGWSHDDVRCALAAAVVPASAEGENGRRAWLAGLADVNVWLRQPGGWLPLLGDLKDGLDAGQLTYYLPYHPSNSASKFAYLGQDAVLAITTDGIGDAISMLPGAAAWFADRWRTPRDILSFIGDIGYEDIQFNDDRTAVVIWCTNGYSD